MGRGTVGILHVRVFPILFGSSSAKPSLPFVFLGRGGGRQAPADRLSSPKGRRARAVHMPRAGRASRIAQEDQRPLVRSGPRQRPSPEGPSPGPLTDHAAAAEYGSGGDGARRVGPQGGQGARGSGRPACGPSRARVPTGVSRAGGAMKPTLAYLPAPVLHSRSLDPWRLGLHCLVPNHRLPARPTPEWRTGPCLRHRQRRTVQGLAADGRRIAAHDPDRTAIGGLATGWRRRGCLARRS